MAKHTSKHTSRPWSLVVAITLLPVFVASLQAQGSVLRPSKYACPVTANLFPQQERSNDILKFVFSENAEAIPPKIVRDSFTRVVRRISLSVVTPDGDNIWIPFKWKGAGYGEYIGVLWTKADGSPNCFSLELDEPGLPGNIPCIEFILTLPPYTEVKEVLFSSLTSEYVSVDCPMPELEREIEKAFGDCERSPQDKDKTLLLIQLLEKATPRYDCRRSYDSEPVPAWWLANPEAPIRWVDYLYARILENNIDALRVYEKFVTSSDGAYAEVWAEEMWEIIRTRPLLVLETWSGIELGKDWLQMAMWFDQGDSSINEIIKTFQHFAIQEPKHKKACDEIVSILDEQEPSSIIAQEKIIQPDRLACPVTANLFPEEIRRTDFIRYLFQEANAFPRRLSMTLVHPQKKDFLVEFRWTGERMVRTGFLFASGEGKTDCYLLGYEGIAEDDNCKEFLLFIPEDIIVKEIRFSNRWAERRDDTDIQSDQEPSRTQTTSLHAIKEQIAKIDQDVKDTQSSDQKYVARKNPLDHSSPGDSWQWKRIMNWDESDNYFEGYWSCMKVAVWTKDSKVAFVSITEWSDSGDWAIYINYYFDNRGRLLHIFTDFRTAIDDLKTLDFKYFQEDGLILDHTIEYYALSGKSDHKLSIIPEHLEQPIHEIPVYIKVTDLPFYDLIDLNRKSTGPVKSNAGEPACW